MAGRAGRRGLDAVGTVVVAAWEDVPGEAELRSLLTGAPRGREGVGVVGSPPGPLTRPFAPGPGAVAAVPARRRRSHPLRLPSPMRPPAPLLLPPGRGVSLESQFRLTYSMILNLLRVEDLKVGF
jgi:hypothetical protein